VSPARVVLSLSELLSSSSSSDLLSPSPSPVYPSRTGLGVASILPMPCPVCPAMLPAMPEVNE
jgi:hypothetical protein